jgi:hypothetical protein
MRQLLRIARDVMELSQQHQAGETRILGFSARIELTFGSRRRPQIRYPLRHSLDSAVKCRAIAVTYIEESQCTVYAMAGAKLKMLEGIFTLLLAAGRL